MKKIQVVTERRCGLKKWDNLILLGLNIQDTIDKTIEIYLKHPMVYDNRPNKEWSNVSWAHCNGMYEIGDTYNVNMNGITYNLDEVYTDEQIDYIKTKCNITIPYVPSVKRK